MEGRGEMGVAVRAALRDRLLAWVTLRFSPEETWRLLRKRDMCHVRGEAWAEGEGARLHIRFCAVARHVPSGWQVLRVDMAAGMAENE
ncbi:MAG: hypothetical protein ACI4OY_08260 [Aristaeellaceae bacterium]